MVCGLTDNDIHEAAGCTQVSYSHLLGSTPTVNCLVITMFLLLHLLNLLLLLLLLLSFFGSFFSSDWPFCSFLGGH